jgi:hypothetical protein
MNMVIRPFLACGLLCLGYAQTAQAGLFWNKKDCTAFDSAHIIEQTDSRSGSVEVKGPVVPVEGKVEGASSSSKRVQGLSTSSQDKREDLFRQCKMWQAGRMTTEQFNHLVQTSEGLETAIDRDTAQANREAKAKADEEARKADAKAKDEARKADKARRRQEAWAATKASVRSWGRLGSAAAIIGGGIVVYTTTETAKKNQSLYGPKDEWDELTRQNTLGWYAVAGGVVMMKVALSTNGRGISVHGAF